MIHHENTRFTGHRAKNLIVRIIVPDRFSHAKDNWFLFPVNKEDSVILFKGWMRVKKLIILVSLK